MSDPESTSLRAINLTEKLSQFQEHWSPRIVGELNGQHVKLVKIQGEFVWHHHDTEDELFLVVKGGFYMEWRDPSADNQARRTWVGEGEFFIMPRGVEHRPVADAEAHLLLFEPAGTLNTGSAAESVLTVREPGRL